MATAEQLITKNLDLWSSAVKAKSSAGRGSSKKLDLYGISKLRELINDLAVRGMLVQQDPNDEPASKYLERTAAAKIELLKEKKIKKQKPLANIETDSMEYRLPRGWQWERLGNLVEMYNGRAFKSSEWRTEGLPIVRIQNLNDNKADFNYFQGELSDSNRISNGTFLISWSGTPGTSFGAFIWERGEAALNQHINKCEFHSNEVNLDFMRLAVNGQMNHFISKAQGGVGLKHVTKGTLNNAILGIPPLAEQHRIVAKVDELMALCNQLEQEQENNLETHETLVSTLLDALTSATADDYQSTDTWERIQNNFDILFTTERSIEQLKQTILQLATMGKLVPQDPKDQHAIDLIRLVKDSLPNKKSSNPFLREIGPEILSETNYSLPQGWAWVPLGNVGIWATGCGFPKEFQGETGKEFLFCKVSDMNRGGNEDEIQTTENTIDSDTLTILRGKVNPKGTIIFPKIGGAIATHKRRIICKPTVIDNNCSGIQPIGLTANRWLLLLLQGLDLTKYQSGTSVPAVSQSSLDPIRIGLPPIAEQHRIVAKVDELMALCDQLKTSLTDAQETQLKVANSIVEKAIQ